MKRIWIINENRWNSYFIKINIIYIISSDESWSPWKKQQQLNKKFNYWISYQSFGNNYHNSSLSPITLLTILADPESGHTGCPLLGKRPYPRMTVHIWVCFMPEVVVYFLAWNIPRCGHIVSSQKWTASVSTFWVCQNGVSFRKL
jgi:hypothetical protein